MKVFLLVISALVALYVGMMNGYYWGVKICENRYPTLKECFTEAIEEVKYAISLYRK